MTQEEARDLFNERASIMDFIRRAELRVRDIDERLRLNPEGSNGDDFSGAVEALRKKGVLPQPSNKK